MILLCWHCGAELPERFQGEWYVTSVQCGDCGLVQADAPATLAPTDDEVDYALDEWEPADRVLVSSALIEDGILYRWDDGLVLAVPAPEESRVDAILDDLEAEGGDAEDDESGEDLDEDADGGEEAHDAMQRLFVAADRLAHNPSDEAGGADLAEAAGVVAVSLPPYGIEAIAWRRTRELAEAAIAAVHASAPDEAVTGAAGALREFLRQYV